MRTDMATNEEARFAPPVHSMAVALVSRAAGILSAITIVVVTALTALAVFNRYVLGTPIRGIDEGLGFLVVASVMFGAAETLRRNEHVRIDMLVEMLGPRAQRLLDVWANLSVLIFALVFGYTAWHTVQFTWMFGAYSPGALEIPMWLPQSSMLLGAALLVLVALDRLLAQFAGGRAR